MPDLVDLTDAELVQAFRESRSDVPSSNCSEGMCGSSVVTREPLVRQSDR